MVVGAVEIFSLGVIKASIIGQNKLRSGLEFLTIGAVATAFGYGIGLVFH
jgi:VIT1/CCC1 family predicted Fe2+/Mn2+ transporter